MHINHGLVIGGSQSSLACYVDNHNCLFVFESGEINELPSDILDFEVKEGLSRCVEFLTSLFEEDRTHKIKYLNDYNHQFHPTLIISFLFLF